LACHRRAFEWFGVIPTRLIIDNPSAITCACVRDPVAQRAYAECADRYGFKIDPCPPAAPGVKYVKGNFLPTRTFRDLVGLNEEARRSVLEEAGCAFMASLASSLWSVFSSRCP
jgi:transposase